MKKRFFRRSCARDEGGATIVEFAILLPVFISFVLGIIDICAYFFVAGQLQYAVEQASRSIRVGKTTVIGDTSTQGDAFRALVCDNISAYLVTNCTTSLQVDVRSFDSFDTVTLPATQDVNGNGVIDPSEVTYCAGEPSTAVVARTFFNYSTIVPGLAVLFAAVVPGTVTIEATTTFRTEPYESNGVSCP